MINVIVLQRLLVGTMIFKSEIARCLVINYFFASLVHAHNGDNLDEHLLFQRLFFSYTISDREIKYKVRSLFAMMLATRLEGKHAVKHCYDNFL